MRAFVITLALVTSVACGQPASVAGRSTANLTAPGVAALNKAQLVKYLDVVRDLAVDGEAMKVIATPDAVKVVQAHKSAVLVVQASAPGWQAAVIKALEELPKNLSPDAAGKVTPYVGLTIAFIKEVF